MDISIYKQAPDLLLNKLAEVNTVLSKNKNGHNYKFWREVSEVMRFAYNYMNDLKFIQQDNDILLRENHFLKSYTAELLKRLNTYETIRAELMNGGLNESIKIVKKATEDEN